MRIVGLIVVILFLFLLFSGCVSNERVFQVNVKSFHTWTIYLNLNVKVWKNYSNFNEKPDYEFTGDEILYVDEIEVFDIILNFDKVEYIEISVNASTIDGFYNENVLTSFDLDDYYNFGIIGSGNEVRVINSA